MTKFDDCRDFSAWSKSGGEWVQLPLCKHLPETWAISLNTSKVDFN
ncbi:MAG: hypothetical protein LBQ50_14155 [Planctomycetaceae bacterium]|nr:hypothetical protein [Planctomycetaceae bacterium]